jgi:hypothetical protein
MRSYKMQKKGDHYSTGAPKALFTDADRISAEMVTTRRGHNVRQAQPVGNMEFVLIKTFFLLMPNGDFILHFPLDGK